MNLENIKIIKLDREFKESTLFDDFYNYRRQSWAELDPDKTNLGLEDYRNIFLEDDNKVYETKFYGCLYDGKFVGNLWLNSIRQEYDAPAVEKETGFFQCYVAKEQRRKGIGTALLKKVTECAKEWGIKKLKCGGCSFEPAKDFCRHFGGVSISKDIERRFHFKDTPLDLVESFSKPTDKNSDFTIEFSNGIPQNRKDEFIRLLASLYAEACDFMEDSPHDVDFYIKEIKEEEKNANPGKEIQIKATARTKEGEIVGLTNISIEKLLPNIAYQAITGVRKDFRGRGLALRLKAEMALHIRNNYPQVECITTYTNSENKWMAQINERMGFKIHEQSEMFAFDVEELGKKLGV